MTPPFERLAELLRQFPSRRIAVVGDLMLDRFIYGDVDRISPEAPVPVVRVRRETAMPGGASNVARNVRALGGKASVSGLIGSDREAEDLLSSLCAEGVETGYIVQGGEARTTVKTRIIAERQQVVRVDWDHEAADGHGDLDRMCEAARLAVECADGVILEDYGKGVVQQAVVDAVLEAAAIKGIPAGYDPKDNHRLSVPGVTVATPNRKEAFHAAGEQDPGPEDNPLTDTALRRVGDFLLASWKPHALMITLGAHGMLVLSDKGEPVHVPTRAREVFDVSGAGDTVIAACVLALSTGASVLEAAELSNLAAGVVVAKLGTATCSPDELLGFVS